MVLDTCGIETCDTLPQLNTERPREEGHFIE